MKYFFIVRDVAQYFCMEVHNKLLIDTVWNKENLELLKNELFSQLLFFF